MNDIIQLPAPAGMAQSGEAFGPQVNLNAFVEEFGDGLLASLNRSHPPVYDGEANPRRQAIIDALKRAPFPEQAEVVQAISALLLDRHEPAEIGRAHV